MNSKNKKLNSIYLFFIILLIIFCVGPLIFLTCLSIYSGDSILNFLQNYTHIIENKSFIRIFCNSLIIAIASTIITLNLSIMASYALTRRQVRFRKSFLLLFLSISTFPSVTILSALYMLFRALNLRDNILILIIIYTVFSLPFAIWTLAGYFKRIPVELEESAKLDGCTDFSTFKNILLPLISSGIAFSTILIFIYCWNEFIFAVTFTTTDLSRTLPVDISLFPPSSGYRMGELCAESLISSIPLIIIILFCQKKILSGLTSGSVKE